jgi:hypothetical protein
VAQTGRKSERWCTLGSLCRELDWSRPRLIHELQNGLRCRIVPHEAVPPGYVIDWHSRVSITTLDIEASTVEIDDPRPRQYDSIVIGPRRLTVGIEVLPPTDTAEDLASPPAQRWQKPPPRDVLEAAALAVAKTYQPDDPPTQAEWWKALNAQLGADVTRKVALRALVDWAPQWQRQRGQKRNRRS